MPSPSSHLISIRLALFGAILSTLSPALGLAEDCHCSQYESLVGISQLGATLGDVSLLALHPEQDPFSFNEERRQAVRTRIMANSLIPSECKDKLLKEIPSFVMVIQGTVATSPQTPVRDFDQARVMLDSYQQATASVMDSICPPPGPNATESAGKQYVSCVAGHGVSTFTQAIAGQGESVFQGHGFTKEQMDVLSTFNHVLGLQTDAQLDAYLKSQKDRLTTRQKIELGVMLSGAGGRGYGDVAGSTISLSQFTHTIANNSVGAGTNQLQLLVTSGVCRNIAASLGIYETALGIPHSVVVGFSQVDGGHGTWAGQDPDHPLINHQANYGLRGQTHGGSTRSLNQGVTDISLNYALNLPTGRAIANLQSPSGIWLANAAGFRPFDPLARNDGFLLGGEAGRVSEFGTRARLGVGQDANGAQYLFLGGSQNWLSTNLAPGQATLLYAQQDRPSSAFGNPDHKTYSLDTLYGQLEQKIRSKDLKITQDMRARFEAKVGAMAMLSRLREGGKMDNLDRASGATMLQGIVHLTHSAIVNQGAEGSRTQATYKAEVQSSFGTTDVQRDWPGGVAPVLDGIFLSADVQHRLASTPQGQLYLVMAAQVALNELSERGRAEIGLKSDHLAFTFGGQGRLTNSSATFEAGTAREVFGMLSWVPHKNTNIGATVYVPVERDSEMGTKVMGTALVGF